MYKDAEKRSLRLMKRGKKVGAPSWLMDYSCMRRLQCMLLRSPEARRCVKLGAKE